MQKEKIIENVIIKKEVVQAPPVSLSLFTLSPITPVHSKLPFILVQVNYLPCSDIESL